METDIDTMQRAIEALGLNYQLVASWALKLYALRFIMKLFSAKLQGGMEKAIASAVATGNSSIINGIASVVASLPWQIFAWLVDTVFSFKLPLKVNKPLPSVAPGDSGRD